MKKSLFALALMMSFASGSAQAKVIGVASGDNGDQLQLHDDLGTVCTPGSIRVTYTYVKTYAQVEGCAWLLGTELHIKFADGDTLVVPVSAIKEPVSA